MIECSIGINGTWSKGWIGGAATPWTSIGQRLFNFEEYLFSMTF